MKALRTADQCFENLPGYRFAPHYTDVDDGDGGTLRIHHVDEGPSDGPCVLLMHGQPSWSYLYRHMIPILADAGLHVLAPDLVGFGRSDKPSRREDFSYQRQVDWLTAWLVGNDVRGATFFGQDWGGLIGLRLVAENTERFERVVISNTALPAPTETTPEFAEAVRKYHAEASTPSLQEMAAAISGVAEPQPHGPFVYWQKWCWDTEDIPVGMLVSGMVDGRETSPAEAAAYDAPFPDPSYKMGPRAMPSQVPLTADAPSVAANLAAWKVFSQWEKPFLCCFSDNDPVTSGGDQPFKQTVPGAANQPHQTIKGGGHFLQEGRGEELARILTEFCKKTR